MRRTRLMIRIDQEDEPGDEDRQELPPRARGRDQPAPDDDDRRHRREGQAAVQPGRTGIDLEQRRGEQEVEAGRPDGEDRHRRPVDARRQPTARIGQDEREQQDGRGVLERQADLVDDRDLRSGRTAG